MNHMKEVAALLGVELDEEFKIINYNCKETGTYILTEDGLAAIFPKEEAEQNKDKLQKIINHYKES